jgi:hypothetical protein
MRKGPGVRPHPRPFKVGSSNHLHFESERSPLAINVLQ